MSEQLSDSKNQAPASNLLASPKLAQEIYYQLTGKTEKLTRIFKGSRRVCDGDVRNLYDKLHQYTEQYDTKAHNIEFNIHHSDDMVVKCSSYEKYLLYNRSLSSPIESMEIKFTMLIKLPQLDNYNHYELLISIDGRDFRKKYAGFDKFIRIMGNPTMFFSITYVDHVVAISLMSVVDNWISSLSAIEPSCISKFILNIYDPDNDDNYILSKTVASIILVVAAWSWWRIGVAQALFEDFRGFYVASAGAALACYIFSNAAKVLIGIFRDSLLLDKNNNLIVINKGDEENEKLLKKIRGNGNKGVLLSFVGLVSIISINVFSNYLYELLRRFM